MAGVTRRNTGFVFKHMHLKHMEKPVETENRLFHNIMC